MNFYLKDIVYRRPKANDLIFDKLNLPLSLGPLLLLGRNGAGKTTLLKLIAGLLKPASGTVHRDGRVLYLPQRFIAVPGFSCMDYVVHLAWLNGRPRREAKVDAASWIKHVGLEGYEQRPCQNLSGGQQSRLALAMALNSHADLVLLDEPGAALDPLSKETLRSLYQIVADAGVGLMVSSHDPTDILGPFARVMKAWFVLMMHQMCSVLHNILTLWWKLLHGRCFLAMGLVGGSGKHEHEQVYS